MSPLPRRATADLLRDVAEGTAATTGGAFFRALTRHLATAFGLRYCFVAECLDTPPTRVATLAFWDGSDYLDNFEYDLAGTPCQTVLAGTSCIHPADIQALFPTDADLVELGAESYAAVPMHDAAGRVIGHLAALDVEPFDPRGLDMALLRLFAARAGAELERQRVVHALETSQVKYRALFDASNDGIVLFELDGTIVDANPQAAAAAGFAREALIGRSVHDIQPASERANSRQRIANVASRGRARYTIELKRRDGTRYPAEISASLVSFDDRTLVLSMLRDISRRRAAEAERARLQEQVLQAQKLESLGVLAGGIAHDFNNLLVGVLGNADLALDAVGPRSAACGFLDEIERAARRAAELCQQMLAYSGRGQFIKEVFALDELVDDMAHLLRSSLSKKATLHLEHGERLPPIEADATQIRQVALNLITNASDALQDQIGTITVRTRGLDLPAGYTSAIHPEGTLPAGHYACLEVIDTGCGMDLATRARIFDPFFTTKFTGRGLGLAAVLGIVHGHGGAIEIESKPGRGATFRVLLPASTAAARPTHSGAPSTAVERPGGMILVVDDEDTVRQVAGSSLEQAGYRVLLAENGRRALEIFRAQRRTIDLVLLDMTMPDFDGAETFRALREIDDGVRVVLSSGYNEQEVTRHFDAHRLAGFLHKPYRPRELVAKIDAAVAATA